jgi:ComF family protein
MYQEIWNLIYPKCCPVCFSILEDQKGLVCPKCDKKIRRVRQPYCYQCGRPLLSEEEEYCYDCEKGQHVFDRGFSVVEYDGVSAPSILAVKYKNKREFIYFYGEEARVQYQDLFRKLKIECIIPVPISKQKRRKRGFNQAEVFANELSKWMKIPVKTRYLSRVKDTLALKELNPMQRKIELLKAFFWEGKSYAGEKNVLLVDDIYTSGATVDACANVLKQHGIQKVYVLTMAIGRGNN